MTNTSLIKKNIVALVPLRGGSKGIPNKNIKMIAGKPLCAWVLEAACDSKLIDKVYVSTDSENIKTVIKKLSLDIIVIDRPNNLATDESTTEEVMKHFKSQVNFDLLVTIQATSPMLKSNDLDNAIEIFNIKRLNSMLSAVRVNRFFWSEDATPLNYDPKKRPLRQNFKGTMMENGAFYITDFDTFAKFDSRLGGKIGIFEMSDDTAVEIDEPEDWRLVKNLLELNNKK